jgi:hypothetical protein
VSAWPEPPSAMSAERSAGVRDGMEALAFGGTETPSDRAGEEHSGVEAALNHPGRFFAASEIFDREGLFNLIKGAPSTLKYQPGVIVREGDCVIIHGRFSGNGSPRRRIAADVVPIADDVLAEHWDVLQDEATRAESKSGQPMFGDSFAD